MATCAQCKFSSPKENSNLNCRRYAPRPEFIAQTAAKSNAVLPPVITFPVVKKDDWCGDFVYKT